MIRYDHFIAGAPSEPKSKRWFATVDPYTGQPWAEIAEGSKEDVDRAVAAAKSAFEVWSATKPSARGKVLVRLADLIETQAQHLAEIEVRDNGKLYAEMFSQVKYLAEWYRYYGGLADKIEGAVIPSDKANIFNFTRYEPLGVIGMITPWNSPLLLLAWKLAAALAAGNTAVVKPSEYTSASTLEFMKLFEQAGFPAGVVNTVTGFGAEAGAALASHPDVMKIAFTGSDIGGQKVYEAVAKQLKHVSLELGGKSPNIVFDDAPDLERVAKVSANGIFRNSGQVCVAGSRLLVQHGIHDALVERLARIAASLKVGDPLNLASDIGAVSTEGQLAGNLRYARQAEEEGARRVIGGERILEETGGYYQRPAVFDRVRQDMTLAREEVFGPLLAVIPFEDADEAVRLANATEFGLASAVWTSNLSTAHRMARAVRAGVVHVNTYGGSDLTVPLGGHRQSGNGHDKSLHALGKYTDLKTVWIQL